METKIFDAIYKAIERLNEMRDSDSPLEPSADTVIAGPGGGLDSMGLINLLLFTEEELLQALGHPVEVMSAIGERPANTTSFTIGDLAELIRQENL